MSSTWGEKIKLSIFGGSHTEAIGVTIDCLPAGRKIDFEKVLLQMSRRAPGNDKTATSRKEADFPEVLCGLYKDVTTGDPLTAIIRNTSQRSKDYDSLRYTPRPGHSDYAAYVKYNGENDIRGGGHFSGRLTAPIVFAGAICRQILENIGVEIGAHVSSIGLVEDDKFDKVSISKDRLSNLNTEFFSTLSPIAKEKMYDAVEKARINNDSIGGTIECAVVGLEAGVGEPMFGGVENKITSIVYGIPAVKGIEFGDGFNLSNMYGSESNDAFCVEDNKVKTRTNHMGGILGGISTGMPIVFKVAFKPTPSISQPQQTVNLKTMKQEVLEVKGRHDPCVVPRAVPVVEAAAAIAIADMLAVEGKL